MPLVTTLHTGNKYGPEYVERLYKGLARHTTGPFSFEVITKSEYPGWWGKIELFPPKERTVFIDLDVVITGNIDFLFEYEGKFCAWKDPWATGLNSSVMSIGPGFGAAIWSEFERDPGRYMRQLQSDQQFLNLVTTPDYWPAKLIQSYKADNLAGGPKDARIVVFHGQPKPADFRDGWVREHWNG